MSFRRPLFSALILTTACLTATADEAWPQWGGPRRDFTVGGRELARDWGESGPPLLWSRPLGGGFAAIVGDGSRLYATFRDGGQEVVVAMHAGNGTTVWERRFTAAIPDSKSLSTEFGRGPNATPLLVGDRLITLGFTGQLRCLDVKRGRLIWSHDLGTTFDVRTPYFGHAASPLAVDRTVIVVAGGVLAFDLASGEVAWQNRERAGNYGSPRLVELSDDSRQIVTPLHGTLAGLDPSTGATLWQHELANQWGTILTSPVIAPNGRVFISASEVGSMLVDPLRARAGDGPIWTGKPMQVDHSNAVFGDGVVYASHGGTIGLVSATALDTGEQLWKERGFSKVNLLRVGELYLVLDFEGELGLVELTREGMRVVTRATIGDAPTWTPPTLIGTTLYVRDESRLRALDLAKREPAKRRGSRRTAP